MSEDELPDADLDRWDSLIAAAVRSAGKPPPLLGQNAWGLPQRQILVSFDPAANAVYVTLDENPDGVGPTQVTDAGVIVDTDSHEHIRGLEFLAVRERGLPSGELPALIRRTLDLFEQSRALASEACVTKRYHRGPHGQSAEPRCPHYRDTAPRRDLHPRAGATISAGPV